MTKARYFYLSLLRVKDSGDLLTLGVVQVIGEKATEKKTTLAIHRIPIYL